MDTITVPDDDLQKAFEIMTEAAEKVKDETDCLSYTVVCESGGAGEKVASMEVATHGLKPMDQQDAHAREAALGRLMTQLYLDVGAELADATVAVILMQSHERAKGMIELMEQQKEVKLHLEEQAHE